MGKGWPCCTPSLLGIFFGSTRQIGHSNGTKAFSKSMVQLYRLSAFDGLDGGLKSVLHSKTCHYSRAPSSNCSHSRRVASKDRLLFYLPPLSCRRTNFARHSRSVQARVSLCNVNPDRAARPPRWPEWGREERVSFRSGASGCKGRSEKWDTGLLKAGEIRAERSRSGKDEAGADKADME